LLAGIFALARGVTLPMVRALVIVGLIHFALAQVRNADLLAMLAPLYLAAPLARQLDVSAGDDASGSARGVNLAAFVAMIMMTGLALGRDMSPAPINTPAAAIASADLTHAGPVLNDYSFGGYLIFAGIPTFIDGRGELFGGQFIARYNRDVSLADLPGFLELLDQYKFGATLLRPDTPAVALLDRLPEWQRVFSDSVAVIHKRRDAPKK
jgi:hypothetical protein